MADDPLIVKAIEKIAAHEVEIMRLRAFVNEADRLNGLEPRFDDVIVPTSTNTVARAASKRWQAGEFFNKPLSGVVRQILFARAEAAGGPSPASVDDIHEALMQGTFNFETTGADAQKNGIRISLGKNSAAFVRLPNTDLFGLVEWYGKKPGKPGRKATSESAESEAPIPTDTEEASSDNGNGEQQEKGGSMILRPQGGCNSLWPL